MLLFVKVWRHFLAFGIADLYFLALNQVSCVFVRGPDFITAFIHEAKRLFVLLAAGGPVFTAHVPGDWLADVAFLKRLGEHWRILHVYIRRSLAGQHLRSYFESQSKRHPYYYCWLYFSDTVRITILSESVFWYGSFRLTNFLVSFSCEFSPSWRFFSFTLTCDQDEFLCSIHPWFLLSFKLALSAGEAIAPWSKVSAPSCLSLLQNEIILVVLTVRARPDLHLRLENAPVDVAL